MSKKRIWGVVILILIIGLGLGGVLLMRRPAPEPETVYKALSKEVLENIRNKRGIASTPPRAAKPGYKWESHGDHWHEVQVSLPSGGVQPERSKGDPLNIDWERPESQVIDWTDPRTLESYRNYYGFDPPNGDEFHIIEDDWGMRFRHFRNTAAVVGYGRTQGFRPTVKQFARYRKLQADLDFAKMLRFNDEPTPEEQQIRQEIRELVDSAQGEIPSFSQQREHIYYGDKLDPETRRTKRAEATRDLYKRMGIEHLYEFYEVEPYR